MRARHLLASIVGLAILGAGCGSGTEGTPTGSGGSQATGGSASGGTPASGGTVGGATGGTVGTGGAQTTGTGGVTAGTGGSAGRSGTGGRAAGGSPGSGGAAAGVGGHGGGSASGGTAGNAATGGAAGSGAAGNGGAMPSAGCGKTPTLKNSPSSPNQNTLTVGGASRQFLIRWPSNYDNSHPYRLILDFHGATGKDTDLAPSYFGLFDLSKNTTIFVAPSAVGGVWDATSDTAFVDEILKTVEGDLCIDTSRLELEGFSQGGAMIAVLACARPGVFRAAVGHSRGGLTAPTTCQPIPYLGSLGLHDVSGNSQATQTDAFAKWDGCTIENLPTAPTGGHICTAYKGCMAADPVIWCSYDGPHTASPTDSGQSMSWMPAEVWPFLSQF